MLLIWAIIVLLISSILALLLMPLIIYGNSDKKKLFVSWGRLFKASLVEERGSPYLYLISPIYRKKIDIVYKIRSLKPGKAIKAKTNVKSSKSTGKSSLTMFKYLKDILRTFEVRYFRLDFDTDDYIMNGQLYPVLALMSNNSIRLQTNFEGRFSLQFMVENRLIRLVVPIWRLMMRK